MAGGRPKKKETRGRKRKNPLESGPAGDLAGASGSDLTSPPAADQRVQHGDAAGRTTTQPLGQPHDPRTLNGSLRADRLEMMRHSQARLREQRRAESHVASL